MQTVNSVLPTDLLAQLRTIGETLAAGRSVATAFHGLVEKLDALDPACLSRAEPEIVEGAGLYHQAYRSRRMPSFWSRFVPTLSDEQQLARVPGLEYLFLFHRDGRVREAALRKVHGSIPSAFLLAAIAWRLNDWVAEVRAAAVACSNRTFAVTAPDIVARAAMVLLERDNTWRGCGSERGGLHAAFSRPEVCEQLADLLATKGTGPSATILRYALRNEAMDPHLPHLAAAAKQPAARAVARQTLIDCYASWPEGWCWRWIDKSMGIRRARTVFERRPLTLQCDRHAEIKAGLLDRSAAVRNVAASGLIRYREEVQDVPALAELVLADRSRRVRERAAFLLRSANPL